MSNTKPTDLDLLAMRAEGLADRSIGIRFDKTHEKKEEALVVSSLTPPQVAHRIKTIRAASSHLDATTPPRILQECEKLLALEGWNVQIADPSLVYVIPPGVSFTAGGEMHRSDTPHPGWLRHANPGNWQPIEWVELLEGKLGPWVMATEGNRVVSLTHAPTLLTRHSVEAGAWTDPAYRGRGFGAAVTAEWADVLRPSGRVLFYSTVLQNRSSQRLAERLGLRLIGRQWLLRNGELEDVGDVHPASSLRM